MDKNLAELEEERENKVVEMWNQGYSLRQIEKEIKRLYGKGTQEFARQVLKRRGIDTSRKR